MPHIEFVTAVIVTKSNKVSNSH